MLPNQTDRRPTLAQLTAWYYKIVERGSLLDGKFFHWHIRDRSYIVEYCSPIGEETYFRMYREGPCNIVVR